MSNKAISWTLVISLLFLAMLYTSAAQPAGANITFNTTEIKQPAPADYLNTSGGSFTTIILSAETQNLRWKAYAGNVTGVLTLDDSGNYSIYQWTVTNFTGEVYASRNNSISWPDITCANDTEVIQEEIEMNHTTSSVDSINNTFSYKIHKEFYVGTKYIQNSTCKSTFTWVQDAPQTPSETAPYQELLLHDGSNLVYTTFIDDNFIGFNYKNYDFQMIVAEKGVGGYPNTRYYFYMELQ